ncbi:MAG: DNA recombination protein RmuC [Eubacteriales bacterium]
MDIVITVLCAVIIVLLVFLIIKLPKGSGSDDKKIKECFTDFGNMVADNIKRTNDAFLEGIKENIKNLNGEMEKLKKDNSESYVALTDRLNKSLKEMTDEAEKRNEKSISALNESFKTFTDSIDKNLTGINDTVSKSLEELRRQNAEKLGEIKTSVDERLKNTLDMRLKESFENVVQEIGNVNKAIGEIKSIANDVGSLKNVLTNVKTKGIVGEVILGNIIKEILAPNQYEENAATRKGSTERVEFAVKMPTGKDDEFIYLPIDSKFPLESYYAIKDGVNEGDKQKVDEGRKQLRNQIKRYAKDIASKYIDPPYTTDFAIMFIPLEGLYAEIIDSGLFEELQREYKINIVGPSTLAALLNSLQMGFKSYIINKRSAEVFNLLSNIKKEFEKFAKALTETQKKITEAGNNLDELVGTRTRQMQKQLSKLDELPEGTDGAQE